MKEMACMREMAQLATVLPSATQTNKQRNKQHIREVKGKIKKQRRKKEKRNGSSSWRQRRRSKMRVGDNRDSKEVQYNKSAARVLQEFCKSTARVQQEYSKSTAGVHQEYCGVQQENCSTAGVSKSTT